MKPLRHQRTIRRAGYCYARAAFLAVAEKVAAATGVPFHEIVAPATAGRARRRRTRFARQAAIYLTVTAMNVRQGELARALKRPRIRILMACRSAEDARDESAVDGLFSRIEAMI